MWRAFLLAEDFQYLAYVHILLPSFMPVQLCVTTVDAKMNQGLISKCAAIQYRLLKGSTKVVMQSVSTDAA